MIYRPVNAFDRSRKWKWTTEPPKNLKPVLTLLNSLDCSVTFSLALRTPSCNRAALHLIPFSEVLRTVQYKCLNFSEFY